MVSPYTFGSDTAVSDIMISFSIFIKNLHDVAITINILLPGSWTAGENSLVKEC